MLIRINIPKNCNSDPLSSQNLQLGNLVRIAKFQPSNCAYMIPIGNHYRKWINGELESLRQLECPAYSPRCCGLPSSVISGTLSQSSSYSLTLEFFQISSSSPASSSQSSGFNASTSQSSSGAGAVVAFEVLKPLAPS